MWTSILTNILFLINEKLQNKKKQILPKRPFDQNRFFEKSFVYVYKKCLLGFSISDNVA